MLFCERANQILNDNAKAAIILPSSILNKDSIYKNTREILFQILILLPLLSLGAKHLEQQGQIRLFYFYAKKKLLNKKIILFLKIIV